MVSKLVLVAYWFIGMCQARSSTLEVRNTWECTKVMKVENCYWQSTWSKLTISPNQYDGTVFCPMGQKCCSNDGQFCIRNQKNQNYIVFYFANGEKNYYYDKANKVTKEEKLKVKGASSQGHRYEFWDSL